ncbi:MAG: hypothetical protein AVDCRST_MAG11-1662 [uncultured Gemmatimonadaceae bacterium]|uniref:Uncharacterized protein n=1 Tax=uncultured Gemmatimonadaceae bacterium TaxID=246130 RepID=A0A6J4KUF4_9BACT|nr:MAG: hypothetical protein AVDCRST_MAG11-1662 [uncultured Gemmatimonadaceae bacterium]
MRAPAAGDGARRGPREGANIGGAPAAINARRAAPRRAPHAAGLGV